MSIELPYKLNDTSTEKVAIIYTQCGSIEKCKLYLGLYLFTNVIDPLLNPLFIIKYTDLNPLVGWQSYVIATDGENFNQLFHVVSGSHYRINRAGIVGLEIPNKQQVCIAISNYLSFLQI